MKKIAAYNYCEIEVYLNLVLLHFNVWSSVLLLQKFETECYLLTEERMSEKVLESGGLVASTAILTYSMLRETCAQHPTKRLNHKVERYLHFGEADGFESLPLNGK